MRHTWFILALVFLLPIMAACNPVTAPPDTATPTVDHDIYNQVPETTIYEPGGCSVVLDAPAPAYTSNTLGGTSSGEIPAGQYDVGVAADYGSSMWYGLNKVGTTNWINGASVSSLIGDCATNNPLADTRWQVTDYADPNNTTGMSTVLLDTTLTALFGADDTIGGSAGCNSYSGTYQLDGTSLTIPGPIATTMMACADDVMAQENVFLTNLQAVAGYKLDNEAPQLHLLNGKGQVIILLRQQ